MKSAEFKVPADHTNTGELVLDGGTFTPDKITLGAFEMPDSLVDQMGGETAIPLKDEDLAEDLEDRAKVHQNRFFFGKDPTAPAIGDQKVSYEIVKPGLSSIVAAQLGSTFGDNPTKAGDPISMLESGVVSAEVMFQNAASANTLITWLLRFVGFLFMTFGFMAIMRPLSVLGSIIGMGTGLVSVVLAGVISLLVIAMTWIAVRPVLAIALIVLAVGGFIWMRKMAAAKPAQA
ncbi:MAG: TMEM43 family protein [Verrucomicrobiaceae bacterium]|nr:TMEM43 family protein [Verrucomicrobiaceae bacterium]